MKILISDIEENRSQFEALHGKGLFLGSSEITSAAGLNRFCTPLELWKIKTGRVLPQVDSAVTKRGRRMEEVVKDEFLDNHPEYSCAKKVLNTYVHLLYDFVIATPDYFLNQNTILEIKTQGAWAKKDWEDGNVPEYAYIQVQWQLGVLGLKDAYVAALIGGQYYYDKKIEFSQDIFEQLLEVAERFLRLVRKDTPPEARAGDNAWISPVSEAPVALDCAEEVSQWVALTGQIEELEGQIKGLDNQRETAKQKILQTMGGAKIGTCGSFEVVRKETQITEKKPRSYLRKSFDIRAIKED